MTTKSKNVGFIVWISLDGSYVLMLMSIVNAEPADSIKATLNEIPESMIGPTVNCKIHFLGKWIKRGGIYPVSPLRIWRNGKSRCENFRMDEHIIVEGKIQLKEGGGVVVHTGVQARYKRWIKKNIYSRLPLGVRAFLYFILRYIFMLGFLDGWQGLAFYGLQGLWYRFLVDLKVHELEQLMQQRNQTLTEVVKSEFGYDLDPSGQV